MGKGREKLKEISSKGDTSTFFTSREPKTSARNKVMTRLTNDTGRDGRQEARKHKSFHKTQEKKLTPKDSFLFLSSYALALWQLKAS